VLGDCIFEKIKTVKGELSVKPLAIEPVNDIAILGSLDDQVFDKEATEYELFCKEINPVKICTDEFKLFDKFPAYIYTHNKTWVMGDAQQCKINANHLMIETENKIEGGTSGSPVINDSGELIGVVSNTNINKGYTKKFDTVIVRPHLTVPVFIYSVLLDV